MLLKNIVVVVVVVVVYRVEKEENSTRQSEYIKLNEFPLRVVPELPSIYKVIRYTRLSICDINSQAEEFNFLSQLGNR